MIGLAPFNLEQELEFSTSTINSIDHTGRTPLAWAAARGDKETIRTLLKYDANPNAVCIASNSPLQLAVRAIRPGAIQPLIEANAQVNWGNTWHFTSLHYAVMYHDDERYVRPLLEAGAEIDAINCLGQSALALTAQYNSGRCAGLLLARGADIESQDRDGWTPLLRSVVFNSHDVLRVLLEWNADHTVRTLGSDTILHVAASKGDTETILLLAQAKLRGFDMEAVNRDGFTATGLLSQRAGLSLDTKVALEDLFHTVEGLNAEGYKEILDAASKDADDPAEAFEDALEHQ